MQLQFYLPLEGNKEPKTTKSNPPVMVPYSGPTTRPLSEPLTSVPLVVHVASGSATRAGKAVGEHTPLSRASFMLAVSGPLPETGFTLNTSVDSFTNFRTSRRLEASQTVSVGTSHGKVQPAGCVGSKDRKLRSRSLQALHVIESRAKSKFHFCCYNHTHMRINAYIYIYIYIYIYRYIHTYISFHIRCITTLPVNRDGPDASFAPVFRQVTNKLKKATDSCAFLRCFMFNCRHNSCAESQKPCSRPAILVPCCLHLQGLACHFL